MAKKKPTYQNVRQGQTIYVLDYHFGNGKYAKPEIIKYFLYSNKTPLPPEGSRVEKLTVGKIREGLKFYGNKDIFFSKKKAYKALSAGIDFKSFFGKPQTEVNVSNGQYVHTFTLESGNPKIKDNE